MFEKYKNWFVLYKKNTLTFVLRCFKKDSLITKLTIYSFTILKVVVEFPE